LNDEADARARIGAVLNEKWTLEKLLGIGGMGAVYAARHRNGARAAVKVLHAELARHAELRDRFLREGYAANRVEHPGAVKVIDDDLVASGPDEGTAYLVMEILTGESLQDRGERVPTVSELEFLGIATQVLDVLEAAHARGVVHRDLKPENVFLAKDEVTLETRVKVLDFGLARLLDAHTTTMQGVALGTPSYMSPEQASGRHDEIDGRTDLFSLAATGFRLVAGRRIHDGENPVQLVTKMANLPAPPIRSVAPRVSAPFARVVDRALQFKREDRYPDAAAMREDVRAAMAELGSEAPVDSRAFAEAKTVVAVAPKPAENAAGNATIELSARDLRPLELPTVVPPSKRVAKLPPPEPAEPAPPRSMKPAPPKPTRDAAVPEGAAPRAPERRAAPEQDEADVAPPKKRRTSFLPSLVIVVLCGVALKITLDAQPPAPEPVRPAPSVDDGATDAAVTDATSRASLEPTTLAADAGLDAAEDTGAADADGDARDAAEEDAGDAGTDAAEDDDARRESPHPTTEPTPAGSVRAPTRPPPAKPRPPPPSKPHPPPRRRGAR
jgi:serine/threonine protein kinase